jgi:hypothetical protein
LRYLWVTTTRVQKSLIRASTDTPASGTGAFPDRNPLIACVSGIPLLLTPPKVAAAPI